MRLFLLFTIIITLCCSCNHKQSTLTKVRLTNQKGFTETVTQKERLKEFENEDSLLQQPHKKIVRIFQKGEEKQTIISTYHPNGHIFQRLECLGQQAKGDYKEWHPNGVLKIQAHILNGIPDIDPSGQNSWIFDGVNQAYDESGEQIALFNYSNGKLEGEAFLFYPSKIIKQKMVYKGNLLHGEFSAFNTEGDYLEKSDYKNGKKDGRATKYWSKHMLASEEFFKDGQLINGVYFDPFGKVISQVKNGFGEQAIFNEDLSYELKEYKGGASNGQIKFVDSKGFVVNSYHLLDGEKHGKEILFYPKSTQPKLSIDWVNGKIHGTVKTWYETGTLESEKLMSLNKKHGISTAWYPDGNLMLIEEYETGLLIKGKYFPLGQSYPISAILKGSGIATLYDKEGIFMRKIEYLGGKPVE